MLDLSQNWSLWGQYAPHGNCYLWQPELVILHSVSDGLISLAYYAIAFALLYLVRKRSDLPFKNVFFLFGAFIISCGTTHLMEVLTIWYPVYWVSGTLKALTAFISVYTVIELIPLMPSILALPSPAALEKEIQQRKEAEEEVIKVNQQLERRVEKRTKELEKSQKFVQKITDNSTNVLYLHHAQEEKLIYVSRAVEKLLGYSPEQLTTQSHIEWLVHPDDRKAKHNYNERLKTLRDGEILEIEYRVQDSAKKWRWLCSSSTVFSRSETGEVLEILGTATDVTARKEAEENLQKANAQLENWVDQLEQQNRDMESLAEINEFLQSCVTVEEAQSAIADLLKPLFPDCSGAVYLHNHSQSLTELIGSWGESVKSKTLFTPDECWGLRRGRYHCGEFDKLGLFCPHILDDPYPSYSLCLPLIAQGESLGLLYLNTEQASSLNTAKQRLARSVSEQIALAFANLKLREELQNQSILDGLTGLYNRRYLEECLERELDRAERTQTSLGVIMLDVDHFKHFNDNWGHAAGDYVLREIGTLLKENIRSSDFACRYGGEELTVIIPESSLEQTYQCAEKLREKIKNLNLEYNEQLLPQVTASLGVATYPTHGKNFTALTHLADAALYQAKQQGRDRVISAAIA